MSSKRSQSSISGRALRSFPPHCTQPRSEHGQQLSPPTGTLRTREGQPGGYRAQPHPATVNFMDSTGAPTAKGGHQEMTGHPSKDVRLVVLCETSTPNAKGLGVGLMTPME